MEPAHHLLEFREREIRHAGVAPARREERQRRIPPIVHQPLVHQVAVIGEHMDRQQLDARHPQVADVLDYVRRRQPAERPLQRLRHLRMQLGESLDVRLVQHRAVPRHPRRTVLAPEERRVDHPRLHHIRRAVALVERGVLLAQHVAEQLRRPGDLPHHRLGVRVQHQLVRVEPMPLVRLVRPVHPIAIHRAGPRFRQEPVPDLVGVFRQIDPADLVLPAIVEQAQLHPRRVGREQREVHPKPGPRCPLRERQAFLDANIA